MGHIPNLFNFWVVIYVAIGATACSYGLAIIGSTVGQPSFYKSLELEADPTQPGYAVTAGYLGAFNGMSHVPQVLTLSLIHSQGSTRLVR